MTDLKAFEPPKSLEEYQIERLRKLQEGTMHLARLLLEILPDVDDRERALQSLRDVKLFGEAAVRYGRTRLTPNVLAKCFAPTEARDYRVVRVWMNAIDYADLRKFGRDMIDVEDKYENLKKGIQGVIWQAEIRTTRRIKQGFIVTIGSDETERTNDADLESGWEPAPIQLVRF